MNEYESEKKLEERIIVELQKQGYEKIEINNEKELLSNFKEQLNRHNKEVLKNKPLSDKEFNRVLAKILNKSVFQSAKELRQKQNIERDNGEKIYIELFNSKDWCKNTYQVTHQINVVGTYKNRYDVTLLINGLPLVQIELKKRGIDFKEAFNQILRYKKHSYPGLFKFIQIFVISNGVDTKYFANGDGDLLFSHTFYWTDFDNNRITNLEQFIVFFLERCHVSKMIARYMVLNETEKSLMILRPYQVYAVEVLIDKAINTTSNGYIWHTTGSGKTLTSFKASKVLSIQPQINQVFFLVDRKDLDKQTLDEFNKYEPNCVDLTDQTDKLVEQMRDSTKPLIVTTIQKMANAVKNPKYKELIDKYKDLKTIFIIDECHRSQFGDMHKVIAKHFSKAQYFGFTGTPRFEINKSQDGRTTADIFKNCLHTYLIKDAIKDENVLGFSVDYIKTMKIKPNSIDEKVSAIDKEEALSNPERLGLVARNIVEHHKTKTRNGTYNAIFAVSSVKMLIQYYDIFKSMDTDLNIGAIFTYEANEDLENQKEHSRDSLEKIIRDYNNKYGTNFSTNNVEAYFKDVDKKFRNVDIDILLVVDMFLTGYNSQKLNTLYLDKHLTYHSLIQAFSRTNRIEKKTKPFGNIVCYDQTTKEDVDEAIKLFSQTNNTEIVLMKPYKIYLEQFKKQLKKLRDIAPIVEDVDNLESEDDLRKFILAFRDLSRTLVNLQNFNDFDLNTAKLGISMQEILDYKSKYLNIYRGVSESFNKVSILQDIDFSLELIQTDKINVAYILNLIREIDLVDKKQQKKDIDNIESKLINVTDDELYMKLDLIKKFLNEVIPNLQPEDSIDDAYNIHMNKEREFEIEKFAKENNIDINVLNDIILEYEYSGIFPDKKIQDSIMGTFIERRNTIKKLKMFILSLVKKYL